MKNIQKELKKLKALLDVELHDNILKLCSVWSEIGIVDSQITERSHKVAYHLNDLLSEMIEEDGKLKAKLIENAHKYTLMASQISSKLQVAFEEPRENMTILEREREMKYLVESLQKEREDRIDRWQRLMQMQRDCSALMLMIPEELDARSEIPSIADIEFLELQVYDVQKELEVRKKQMSEQKKMIKRLVGELDHKVDQQDRIYLADEVGDLLYSNENLKLHKTFVAKLEKIKKLNLSKIALYKEELKKPFEFKMEGEGTFNEEEFGYFCPASGDLVKALKEQVLARKQRIESTIRSKQTELRQWWEKCQVSCGHKDEKKDLLNGDSEKVDCSALKEELLVMESYYNDNKEILDLQKSFRDTFAELSEAEKKCIQLSKYLKTTGSSRDEKHKHKIFKEVFKIQEKLTLKVSEWEGKRGAKFLFGGVDLAEYFEQAHRLLKTNKEAWKIEFKGKQLESLPPVPLTPFKRKIANITPSKIAAKFLKLDGGTPVPMRPTIRTPLSARRIVDNQPDASCKSSRKSNDKQELHRQNSAKNLKVTPRRSRGSYESRQLRTTRRSGQGSNLPSGMRSKGSTNSSSNSFEKNPQNKAKAKEVDETKENFINETASYEDFSRGLAVSDKSFISSSVIVLPKNPTEQKFFEPIKF